MSKSNKVSLGPTVAQQDAAMRRISLREIRNATIRSEIQEKLHGVRGVITEVARRDLMSDRFKSHAAEIDRMLCTAIAELD